MSDVVILETRPCKHPRQDDLDAIARAHRLALEELRGFVSSDAINIVQLNLAKLYQRVKGEP